MYDKSTSSGRIPKIAHHHPHRSRPRFSERVALISAIRSELGSSQNENIVLKQEIAALKNGFLQNRGPASASASSPLATLTAVALSTPTQSTASGGSQPRRAPRSSRPTHKKTSPPAPVLGRRSLQRRARDGQDGGHGQLHARAHTFVPPLAALSRKGGREQENLNPNLNASVSPMIERYVERAPSPPIAEPSMLVQAPAAEPALAPGNSGMNTGNLGASDAFADKNPSMLKTLDAYRMQLWGKMAAQGHLYQQQQFAQQHQHQQQPQLTQQQMPRQQLNAQQQQLGQQQISGLAQVMRPAFCQDAGLVRMLSGKGASASATSSSLSSSSSAAWPSPPSPPKLSTAAAGAQTERESMQRDAMYVALATR
ncbi:hypothetical protein FIBSPDRAFT_1049822 [Athelia psychrophila]|uniref:Uncharacterized protein n=1 Tax=Athelia psychrophila TaxID=1759441 RepID=A0A166BLJ0_9AGAM|nr:hypothetical protein FIBSPDRAFT_1049822 [Fibularhizoctonia sp. CBS 109695]